MSETTQATQVAPVTTIMDAVAEANKLVEAPKEEPTKVEVPAEEPTKAEEPPKPDKFSAAHRKIVEREKHLNKREQELKEELKLARQFREAKEAKSAIKLLEMANFSLEDAFNEHVTQGKGPPTEAERLEKLENDRIAERKAKIEEEYQQEYQKFKGEIQQTLEGSDKYPLTKKFNDGAQIVADVIEQHYTESKKQDGIGRILGYDEACEMVEEYIHNTFVKPLESKIQKKEPKTEEPKQLKTVTNSMATTPVVGEQRKKTKEELYAEMIEEANRIAKQQE